MSWRDVLHIEINGWGIDVYAGIVLAGVLLALVLTTVLVARRGRTWRVTNANFSFAGCGQVEICPDNDVARLAHQAWVELRTRKAAIPFDPEHDVIVEVYNSWYELFRALRELTKMIPPDGVGDNRDAGILVDVLLRALNEGLRPHLTSWQARFRRWYEHEATQESLVTASPQEIQRGFPEYNALVTDLIRVNAGMIEFAEQLRKLAHERKRSFSLRNIFRRRSVRLPAA